MIVTIERRDHDIPCNRICCMNSLLRPTTLVGMIRTSQQAAAAAAAAAVTIIGRRVFEVEDSAVDEIRER